jgi:mono/diheme cytochrome c family protein
MKKNRTSVKAAPLCVLGLTTVLMFNLCSVFGQTPSATPAKDAKTYAALTRVPEKARSRRNPLESDPDARAAGGKLFEQHCAQCHGRKGEGGTKGASLLRPEVTAAASGTLFWILTNGVVWRGMPVWSKLPEPERWQIVTFLKSFKTSVDNPVPPNS